MGMPAAILELYTVLSYVSVLLVFPLFLMSTPASFHSLAPLEIFPFPEILEFDNS